MKQITFQDFEQVELLAGTIVSALPFKDARHPAYIIHADFGPNVGLLKSSAQITARYNPKELIGRQIIGVVNLPAKQIGPTRSQFLVTGFQSRDNSVVLAKPEKPVPNGTKLS